MELPPRRRTIVTIGEGQVARGPRRLETVLGSCIGIALVWQKAGVFGLAHVALPRREDPDDRQAARYGDTAVPWLLQRMRVPSMAWHEVRAVVAGGAALYGDGLCKVGDANRDAVLASLQAHRIRRIGQDVGGREPRRLIIDGQRGTIESLHLRQDDTFATEHRWRLAS